MWEDKREGGDAGGKEWMEKSKAESGQKGALGSGVDPS